MAIYATYDDGNVVTFAGYNTYLQWLLDNFSDGKDQSKLKVCQMPNAVGHGFSLTVDDCDSFADWDTVIQDPPTVTFWPLGNSTPVHHREVEPLDQEWGSDS